MKLLTVFLLLCYVGTIFGLYDLFSVLEVDPGNPRVEGITSVEGPLPGTRALQFAKNTKEVSTDKVSFAYIADVIFSADDYTFYTYYKLSEVGLNKNQKIYYTFFSLREKVKDGAIGDPWFSMSFGYQTSGNVNEGVTDGTLKRTLYVEQRQGRYAISTEIPVNDFVVKDKWQLLVVRIQNDKYSVTIDCKDAGKGKLVAGKTAEFAFGGVLMLSQQAKLSFSGEDIETTHQFVGALYRPTILVGQGELDFYNPCNNDQKSYPVPSEPRPEDFIKTNFDNYIKLTSSSVKALKIFCQDENKVDHYSGTTWVVDECFSYTCKAGVISRAYSCKYCIQNGVNYEKKQTWFVAGKPCVNNTCKVEFRRQTIETSDITCPKLTCNSFGSMDKMKPKEQCCDKCWSDTCTKKYSEFYEGCDRSCDAPEGINFVCPSKSRGCWCKKGYALNDKKECIPASDCPCKSGTKTYKPGQAIRRSQCESCVCASGQLACFKICF